MTQVTKTATKARATKTATKPAAKKSTTKKTASAAGLSYMYSARPSSGKALFAYTQAVLELTGLDKGKSVPKSLLVAVQGATAVNYHLKQKFTYEQEGDQIRLNANGKTFFADRAARADQKALEAFRVALSTGKADGTIVKNQAMLVKVA